MKKKLMALTLVFSFVVASMSVASTAANIKPTLSDKETYVSEELGGTITRTIDKTRIITTFVSFDGEEEYTVVNEGGKVYVDNTLINIIDSRKLFADNNNLMMGRAASPIKWGAWTTFEEKVYTGGKPAVVVAAMIAAVAPMIGLPAIIAAVTTCFAAGAGATAALTDYFLVSGKLRYGHDDVYSYYERYTSLIDDEGTYWITDSYDTGKEYL